MPLVIYAVPLPGGGAGGGSTPPTPGSGAGQSYRHVQTAKASTWVFTHTLDFEPAAVRISDADEPDVEWDVPRSYDAATRTFTLRFPYPVRGQVLLS